ncbi:hypothetical protein GUJ93_ZPchr0013g35812 [Zizania palustris]|uniref:Uncharacterized protein n=1 Tax=Zizania palustris TaxID=103762 RepID=A0A8J5WXL1_ZIZPA|nr:hypothetical protein GUJ93_ZPchr0013g35812 [Zizania palustris]
MFQWLRDKGMNQSGPTTVEGEDGVGGDGVPAGAHDGDGDVLVVLVVAYAHLHEQKLHGLLLPLLAALHLGLRGIHGR